MTSLNDCICYVYPFPNGYLGGMTWERVPVESCPVHQVVKPAPLFRIRRQPEGCWHVVRVADDSLLDCGRDFGQLMFDLPRIVRRRA